MSDSVLVEGLTPIAIRPRPRARIEAAVPFAIFTGVFTLLWLLYGHRLILGTNDEGIYLDAAERILHGQKPYVDFFGYMSPGSFWMQALAFRLFGITLAAGRVLVLLYIALECALIYWLVERYASRAAAIVTALFFLAFQTADPSMLTAQHRWDSGAFALASIAVAVGAQSESRRRWLVASGVLIAAAALATPSIGLVAVVTLIWLAWPAGQRERATWYLLGLAAAGAALLGVLWSTRMLAPLAQQIFWLSRNYAANNAMPYGAIIGGYGALFEGAGALELLVRSCVVFCVALPAILPVVVLAGGGIFWVRRKSDSRPLGSVMPYLLLCVAALAASTYPRSDIAHLAWVSALPYAVAGILIFHLLAARARAWLTISMAVWAAVFAFQAQLSARLVPLHTPVGDVRASAAEAPLVAELLSRVQPGQSLFVYPYKPLFYFLTQTTNPTRYSYLEAGMMTGDDSRLALSELEAQPPEWVLYMDLDRSEFARVFPGGKHLNPHYPQLESWIKANYRPVGVPALGGYVLLRRAIAQ
jgi:4-amino-4-deoxy-L-arabinose transferase-like glycosyltransferase